MRQIITLLLISLISFGCSQPPQSVGIASAHPLATQAGFKIMSQGGNAFDAAIAVASTLAVVEPYSSGLGGGGFWLLRNQKSSQTIMLDARERAPLAATADMYLDDKGEFVPQRSIQGALAAGIPGVPAALTYLASKHGKLPLTTSLQPAIDIARDGFKVDEKYRLFAKLRLSALRANQEAARIFLHNNDVPPAGYILKQPELAQTLKKIARQGNAGFYQGELAQQLVDGVTKGQGIWSIQDLSEYSVVERNPIVFNYRHLTVTSAAPPSSGGIALAQILNILSQFDLSEMDSATQKHLIVEAMRRAYADRSVYLGDIDFYDVPVTSLISSKRAYEWARDIKINEATPSEFIDAKAEPSGDGNDTTHYSIIDQEGNLVAATLSINYPFGACFVPPGTGVLLNDEMDDFSAKPGTPNAYGLIGGVANAIEPGKRPLSSMSPTFIESDNRIAVVGTPGGSRIITMVLLAILEFGSGHDAQHIVNKARFHHQYLPDKIVYETGALTPDEISALSDMGHSFKEQMSPYGRKQGTYGNMQIVIKHKKTKHITAASDTRGIGEASVKAVD